MVNIKMEQHLLAYYIGIFIVMGSHLYILSNPDQMIMTQPQHIYANLAGSLAIAYYFLYKENIINF